MLRTTRLALALAMGASLALPIAAPSADAVVAPSYTITDLGPAGTSFAQAYGISDDGTVALSVEIPDGGGTTTYRWVEGTLTDLDDLPSWIPTSLPRAVNSDGVVVGASNGRAVRWDGTTATQLTASSGGEAWDVSESGVVVGVTGDFPLPGSWGRPFVDRGTGVELLALPNGAPSGAARAVNDNGVAVGYSVREFEDGVDEDGQPVYTTEQLVLSWDADGTPTALPAPPGLAGASPYGQDVNSTGSVLVGTGSRAWVYDGGEYSSVPPLATNKSIESWRMNDHGDVVGRAARADDTQTAFLFDAGNNTTYDLQTLIPSGSGWRLQAALDVNEGGQIVGYGIREGVYGAFLLTPSTSPAPNDLLVANAVPGVPLSTNTLVSVEDPVSTTVTASTAGQVSIYERVDPGYPTPTDYEALGVTLQISGPSGTDTEPVRLAFQFHVSLLPEGLDPTTVTMTRDGVPLEPCDADGTLPDPVRPCLLEVELTSGGDLVVSVLTVDFSEWSLVARESTPTWPFSGFLAPVDGADVVNLAKAGSAVPIRFSLGGDRGLDIFRDEHPQTVRIDCDSGAPTDIIESTVSARSGSLSYDTGLDRYTYVWKSDAKTRGCFALELGLTDGSAHTALFRLR